MNKKNVILLLILSTTITFTGCGGGGNSSSPKNQPHSTSSCLNLSPGVEVTLSQLNRENIYTLNTPALSTKPESNNAPTTTYPYTITSTTNSSLSLKPSPAKGPSHSKSNSRLYHYSLPFGQATLDVKLRKKENELLRKQLNQINRRNKRLSASPALITIGTPWNNVNIIVNYPTTQINTTCEFISTHAYFFVDNRDIDQIRPYLLQYAEAFDKIYDINRNHFGTENDVDSNGRVIIIFSRELESMPGLLGYFYSADKYGASSTNPDSNEGDIFYLTTLAAYQGEMLYGTLAHEFQHMIYFDQHYNRGVTSTYAWLNEALSQAAEYYNNHLVTHLDWVASFLEGGWEGLSLTHWTSYNYGYGAIYIRYLIDQYGDKAIKEMCSTDKVGVDAVEAATKANFNTIFINFSRALVMSGTGDSTDPRYRFASLNLQTVQPNGRGGLTTPYQYTAGESDLYELYPYEISFDSWTGELRSIKLTGANQVGTVFWLSR